MYKKDSKLVRIWKQCSGRPVNIDVRNRVNVGGYSRMQLSAGASLGYMLKYISSGKEDFAKPEDLAKYIVTIRKQRLVNTFGVFFNHKFIPMVRQCFTCKEELFFSFDYEISQMMQECLEPPATPDCLDFYGARQQ